MPRFTMFSTGGRYIEQELAELKRRYEACMAKVNPRDRDANGSPGASKSTRTFASVSSCPRRRHGGLAVRSIFSW